MAEKSVVDKPEDTFEIPLLSTSESEKVHSLTSLSMVDPAIVGILKGNGQENVEGNSSSQQGKSAGGPRFYLSTTEEVHQFETKFVPPKTQASTKWALTVFNSWILHHNTKYGVEKCPLDLLTTQDEGS